jgi:excinuclease UvrABC nuclease subunit
MLESQFIRRYQPRYNTALKRSEFYPYIKIDVTNPWPRVRLVRSKKDDGARYFGPYTSATSARKTVDVINSALPLRTCTRSFANARSYGKPCIALDLKQCLGPCTGKVDRGEYLQHVHTVLNLLDGADDGMYQQLHRQLEDAAEKLDFERADRIRKSILNLTAVLGEQKRTRDAESLHNLLLVLPGMDDDHRDVWMVIHGRLWARFDIDTSAEGIEDELKARLGRSLERARVAKMPPKDHHEVDESGILNRFLFRNEDSEAMVLLTLDERGTILDDTGQLIRRILAVGDDAIASLDVKKAILAETDADDAEQLEDFA